MTGRLEGKRAVVVGAGQTPGETTGNGRATALLFAREGAQVAVVDRRADSAEETAQMIIDEGGRAEVIEADISSEDACVRLAGQVQELFGGVDILHNNVGIGAGDASPVRLESDVWDRIMNVNLKAMWLTCKHVVPVMREQGGGSIVNISSTAAIMAANSLTAYKISKAGVNALTQSLASGNARHGIRANAIMPGLMDTPMAVDAAARASGRPREQLADTRSGRVPMGHQGTAWDVAYAALFLASDEARFISGVILPVDGAQHTQVG